jgi:hypothetical protein
MSRLALEVSFGSIGKDVVDLEKRCEAVGSFP